MTFSVKIWRLIILKVTKKQRFVLSVEKNTFQKTTECQGGEIFLGLIQLQAEGLQLYYFITKRLWLSCFLVNFAQFLLFCEPFWKAIWVIFSQVALSTFSDLDVASCTADKQFSKFINVNHSIQSMFAHMKKNLVISSAKYSFLVA